MYYTKGHSFTFKLTQVGDQQPVDDEPTMAILAIRSAQMAAIVTSLK
jgi:hypothetical protein